MLYNLFKDPPKAVEKKFLKQLWQDKIDNTPVSDLVKGVASKYGFRPEMLYANLYGEGLREALKPEMAMDNQEFGVAGFTGYGLDTFGNVAPELKKKGYIPADFQYETTPFFNEKDEMHQSALFKSHKDAITAQAAYLKDFQDKVKDYASKKGVKLEGDSLDYFTMSAYNAGFGGAKKMIDELGKTNPDEYVSKGLTSQKGIDKNIRTRMRYMSLMREIAKEEEAQRQRNRMNPRPIQGLPLYGGLQSLFK